MTPLTNQRARRATHRAAARRRIALGAVCVASLGLPGCIEEDELPGAIDKVSMELESLAAPGTSIPGKQMRVDTYNEAISTLRPLVNEGTDAQKADAWLLIARSELGLAADPIAATSEARSELASAIAGIRAEVVSYREIAALAAAAESFDPADEIAELQGKILQRETEADGIRSQMAEVQNEIAGLEAQAAEARAAAQEHRRAEASLRSEMMSMSAQDALPLATQAAEQRSRADDLEADAERRMAEADVLRPQITAFESEIDRLADQRTLLEESVESLNAERESTAAEAADYRARATEIAGRVTAAIADANAYRTGPLRQVYDEAVSALETAGESARKATGRRSASSMLSAEIMHSLGGAALAHADALRTFGRAIDEAISDAGITGGGIQTTLSTVLADADAAQTRGEEALREAVDRYQSAGIGGEGADSISDVIASINALLGEPVEDSIDFDADANPDG
ncbi:MAG: hypothetical protein AAFR76_02475 [Planctomycetota bacterium]